MAHELEESPMAEIEEEEEGSSGMEDFEEDDEGDSIDLFWKAVVKPDEPIVASRAEEYFLRITNACLGPDAQEKTRTCLTLVQSGDDDESEAPGVVCTLKNDYENHQLNLLVTSSVQLSVTGDNPSPIYLVGYLSPIDQHMGDDLDLDDDLENMEEVEESEEFEAADAKNKQKSLGRKRKLAELEEEENETTTPAAQKKQKTNSGKAKTQNQPPQQKGKAENKEANKNKEDNKNKQQNQNQNKNQKNQNPNQKGQNKNQNPNQNKNQNPNQNKNPNQNQNKNQKNKKQQANEEKTEEAKTGESATKAAETSEATTASQDNGTKNAKNASAAAKDDNKGGDDTKGWKNGPQGIKYKEVRAGEGKVVKKGSKVNILYVAQLGDKKVVDKVIAGNGFELKVGDNQLIEGIDKALLGMKLGAKRRITIPAKLAYGETGNTEKSIPPNAELTYTLEVKDIN